MSTTTPTPDVLVDALVGAFASMTADERRLVVAAYRMLSAGAAVVSFLLPDGPFDDDVRQAFCHFVHFFASPAAADAWTAQHPGTFWLPVADAAQVGRRLAARAFAAAGVD